MPFFAPFLRQYLRPLLLKGLSWVERETGSQVPSRRENFFQREIRIPAWSVASAVWLMLFASLFWELGPGWGHALGLLLLTGLFMALFLFYFKNDHPEILRDEEAVTLLGVLAVGAVLLMDIWNDFDHFYGSESSFGMPLAGISLLASLLLRPRLAIILTAVLSAFYGIISHFSLEVSLVVCLGGLTATARSLFVRTRGDVSRAGLWVAFTEGVTLVMLGLLHMWEPERLLRCLLWACGGSFLSALGAIALLPSLESFFSRLTNIRLLELSDVNHPLLKRMSLEAPGTYHHSLIMASLAQSAAEAIGANGLLCRVGAYFHDIGKMAKPEYFVENQGALGNPHDPLQPNMSRLVIQSHVKEGLVLARQYRLDKAITDFITMHHGTSRIDYFYRRAVEQSSGLSEVGEDEYRYPGPRPATQETAILMLADSVEASCRAIEEPTHQRLQDQVRKIIDAKMADGQLDQVPLTLADVHAVSDSFVNTLAGVYHARIRYPESAPQAPQVP